MNMEVRIGERVLQVRPYTDNSKSHKGCPFCGGKKKVMTRTRHEHACQHFGNGGREYVDESTPTSTAGRLAMTATLAGRAE